MPLPVVRYLQLREQGTSSAGSGTSFDARLETSGPQKHLSAIGKIFNPETERNGMFLEAFCEVVLGKLGAPRGMIEIALIPLPLVRLRLSEFLPEAKTPVRCSASILIGESATRTIDLDDQRLVEDLLRWKDLPLAAVGDELLRNTDRTKQNLLRIGPSKFVLIDNAETLAGPGGTMADIRAYAESSPGNFLLRILISSSDEIGKRRLFKIVTDVEQQFRVKRSDFPENLPAKCGVSEAYLETAIGFVNSRAQNLRQLIANQLELDDGLLARGS